MNAAALLLLYAAVLTGLGPLLLQRVTRGGITPQLGVAAWLTAIVGVIGAWLGALAMLSVGAAHDLTHEPTLAFCLDTLGFLGHLGLSRQVGTIVVLVLIGVGLAASAHICGRIVRGVRRFRLHTHEHAVAARVIGRPTNRPGVVIVPAREPAAYCVPGPPRAIVVTTAAIDRLSGPQLDAVLAHERAHLSGRHHQLLMVLRALAGCLAWLPLFRASVDAVARLLEMCADDAAVRRHGAHPLLCGLLTLVGRPPAAVGALAAANSAVLARVTRLATPAHWRAQWRERLILTSAISLTTAVPLVVALACR